MYITFTFGKRIVFFLYMHLFSTYSQFCPIFDSKTDHEFLLHVLVNQTLIAKVDYSTKLSTSKKWNE